MANPRRSQRVGQQIMREVSLLILSDKRARCARTHANDTAATAAAFVRGALRSRTSTRAAHHTRTLPASAAFLQLHGARAPLCVPIPLSTRCHSPADAFVVHATRSSAMSPEHRLGADSSISTVTSITDVVISGDLQARVRSSGRLFQKAGGWCVRGVLRQRLC
jgi:hypothetical protein